jgi:hypothetical protein
MDPPAKKMRTSPPTLCDMPDTILAHNASHLEPGDVFNMVLSSKKIFCHAGVVDMTANQEEALEGIKLVKWSMRRRLKEVLKDARSGFTIDDLFPEEERNLDFVSGQPQVSFSLLSHQTLHRHTHKKYRFADDHRRLRGSQVRGSDWIRGVGPWRRRHLLHLGRGAHGPPPTFPALRPDLRRSRYKQFVHGGPLSRWRRGEQGVGSN